MHEAVDLAYDTLNHFQEAVENNNSSRTMLSNTDTYSRLMKTNPMYGNPEDPSDGTGNVSLFPDQDEQLHSRKPLPTVQNVNNPYYDVGAVFSAGTARLTTEEPFYETADAVRQDDK